ncbi:C-C motif chemokine 8-like [Silurus meridionalis]|uniref:C-C motif chemokine 8-like n=1 Tax=Silurus meridionalis TaxID=175797 RepID=UPI001EEB0341|nr:C-C motif chemokine 8-like [Silurus meridionalis]
MLWSQGEGLPESGIKLHLDQQHAVSVTREFQSLSDSLQNINPVRVQSGPVGDQSREQLAHSARPERLGPPGQTSDSIGPATCCFRYQRTPIPIRVITGYKVTDPQCPKSAVIFTLKNNRQVCVDPDLKWVQRHMRRIDQILINTYMSTF